ncbi:hypothetical protein REC12_14235 [Desulfosporosinus sp. PR]|nr:hypothetical protein [Desulfosporosinus sp. PR]
MSKEKFRYLAKNKENSLRFWHSAKLNGKTLPISQTFDKIHKCHFGCKGGFRTWPMFVQYAAKGLSPDFKSATPI